MSFFHLFRRHRRKNEPSSFAGQRNSKARLSLVTLESRITPVRVPPAYNLLPGALAHHVATIATPQANAANSQSGLWTELASAGAAPDGSFAEINLSSFRSYALSATSMATLLASAPLESQVSAKNSSTILALPTPYGTVAHFRIVNAAMMEPGLAAKYPEIRTIRGQGIEDPAAVLDADITSLGFHAQVKSPNGWFYIDPYWHLDTSVYAVYSRDAVGPPAIPFTELSTGTEAMKSGNGNVGDDPSGDDGGGGTAMRSSGATLRTFRLANAATGEYTAYFGGTVAAGQAAIVTAINRVSGIMETELAIRLVLVSNNDSLVYTNASTDPYSNYNGSAMLGQNQTNVTNVIGSANYDIGHVFSTGGGGIASLGVVGVNSSKARGVTGNSSPNGDSFWVDYVIHEMGHQFGADHTFNGVNGSASGNRVSSSAYEPGSGSTIMAYAGICGADNLQAHSDPYYHTRSYDQIRAYIESAAISSVGTSTSTGNSIPTVSAGGDYVIPTGTTFALTAVGSDPDGDALTYGWEERDLGAAQALSAADNGASPIFRSLNPVLSPTRVFPKLSSILSNSYTTSEKIPAVARTASNYRVTIRDNRAGGGGVNQDDMVLTFVDTGSAFAVTGLDSSLSWTGGTAQTITWNVAGTTGNGINTSQVNIRLSTDGGNTFQYLLAENTANDGSELVMLPAIVTSAARIKIEAVNNVYFDISNANLTITTPPPRQIASVVANDGMSSQRSRVTSLTVTFNGQVNVPDPTSAFTLTRIGGGTIGFTGTSSTNGGITTVTLTNFTGAETDFGSLADGIYSLTAIASQITDPFGQALDGDNDGFAGGNYQIDGSQANGLFRYFGDTNGDGGVGGGDFGLFRGAFGTSSGQTGYVDYLDFDGGGIGGSDFGQFRIRFGTSLF